MKRVYWFLLLMIVWCIACAIWYMFAVKGISKDITAAYFNPHERLVAIGEILSMLLIACLIGYGIGWSLVKEPLQSLREDIEQLEIDKEKLARIEKDAAEQLDLSREKLNRAQQNLGSQLEEADRKADSLNDEISGLREELEKERKTGITKFQLEQFENETGSLRFRNKQLEFVNKELEETNQKLNVEIEAMRRPVEPMHPFVRQLEPDEKDDLTVIKGIGPFIEKRLNMVGVYSLRQISEFTAETIEHITKAIEFFPNRIVRDQWVEQAKDLLKQG
jgi:predicted flap endonuclease-1-like 5' DNA nuclease